MADCPIGHPPYATAQPPYPLARRMGRAKRNPSVANPSGQFPSHPTPTPNPIPTPARHHTMKPATLAIAALIASAAPLALASTASEREYQRGYNDCAQGRYDQNQHGESYKKGCRAAEDGQPAAAPAGHSGGKAKIADLKGMDAVKAFDVMTIRTAAEGSGRVRSGKYPR